MILYRNVSAIHRPIGIERLIPGRISQFPEACAANPESCQIDRVSVMNEDGECPEHQ